MLLPDQLNCSIASDIIVISFIIVIIGSIIVQNTSIGIGNLHMSVNGNSLEGINA